MRESLKRISSVVGGPRVIFYLKSELRQAEPPPR